jgi:hypothetical protein
MVIALPDPRVRPKNRRKWHVCVSPGQCFFLRINTNPLWRPWHQILASDNDFLSHDSYVELASLHFFSGADLRRADVIGQMGYSERRALAEAVMSAETLSQEHKDIVWENLGQIV